MNMNTSDDLTRGDSLEAAKRKLFNEIEKRTRECADPESPIPGFRMYRRDGISQLNRYTHEPSLCFVVQGSKHIILGSDEYSYNRDSYLITSIDLPIVAQIVEASPEKPYMGFALKLSQKDIAHMLADGHLKETGGEAKRANRAMTVSPVVEPLIDAFLRLIALWDEPEAIPFLAPTIEREILYRVLTGEGGGCLRQIGVRGTQSSQILLAVEWLKINFTQSLSVEDLALHSQMSLSAFHHNFRSITAMSPLQYQKWLRLQDARRLMLTEDFDATRAAFKVGYESSSQFCREYGRLFGVSPAKDIRLIKQAATG
jgi:AraC-like DNA-binding protein